MSAPIEVDAANHRILFGVGQSGVYDRAFALDSEGDLLVRGAVSERVDLSGESIQTGPYYEASDTSFLMSVDGTVVVLAYEEASERLRLAGQIFEGARWL